MTNIEIIEVPIKQKIELLLEKLKILHPDHELLYFAQLFLAQTWSQEICNVYGRRFGKGIGTTFMQADLNFCKALEEALGQ
jgi:hypothetical protein